MKYVRYTPLLREYLEKLVPLAEELSRQDIGKTQFQLNREVDVLVRHLEIIKFINNHYDNEGPGTTLWQWVAGLFNGIRKKLWGSATRALAVFVLGAR